MEINKNMVDKNNIMNLLETLQYFYRKEQGNIQLLWRRGIQN